MTVKDDQNLTHEQPGPVALNLDSESDRLKSGLDKTQHRDFVFC